MTLGLGMLNMSRSDAQVLSHHTGPCTVPWITPGWNSLCLCDASGTQWRVQQIRGNHSLVTHGPGPAAQQEISFQQFRNQLLAKGLVDKLEVTNKSLVKVYVRTSAASPHAEGSLRSGSGARLSRRQHVYLDHGKAG